MRKIISETKKSQIKIHLDPNMKVIVLVVRGQSAIMCDTMRLSAIACPDVTSDATVCDCVRQHVFVCDSMRLSATVCAKITE